MAPEDPTDTAMNPALCGGCGIEEHRFLHLVRHRGNFRRLCTNCLLRAHPQSFCPTCYAVYESLTSPIPIHPSDAVSCSKCYSSSHLSCVGPNSNKPYTCPICVNPNAQLFYLKETDGVRQISKSDAGALLAAARIAAVTINKAAVAAQLEAEKKSRDAAISRKRAKEAMEHLAFLEVKEKLEERVGSESGEVSGISSQRSAMGSAFGGNFGGRIRMERGGDSSSAVLAAFNAVELREKERLQEVKGPEVNSNPAKVEGNIQSNGHHSVKLQPNNAGTQL